MTEKKTIQELKSYQEGLEKRLNKYEEYTIKAVDSEYKWYRGIIAINSGMLAILISLHNEKITDCLVKTLFVSSIITLTLCILSGTIYLFSEVQVSRRMKTKLFHEIERYVWEKTGTNNEIVSLPTKYIRSMRKVTLFSGLLSVLLLVCYAIILA